MFPSLVISTLGLWLGAALILFGTTLFKGLSSFGVIQFVLNSKILNFCANLIVRLAALFILIWAALSFMVGGIVNAGGNPAFVWVGCRFSKDWDLRGTVALQDE